MADSSIFTTQFLFQIGRTEHLKNTNNPEFSKSVEVEYRFGEVQNMKFCVYDVDNATLALSDDDFLGKMECTLAQVSHIITFHFLKASTRSQIKPKIEILVFSTSCIVYCKVYFHCTNYEYTFQDLLYNFSYSTDISSSIFNHNINLYKTPQII